MHLDLAELRRRLAARSPLEFAVYGDDGAGRSGTTAAAVLIPVIAQAQGLTVLFTQRTQHLKSHSGQVSFPGGRAEPGDASAEFTALREAQEEIGLALERVEILGRLPEYHAHRLSRDPGHRAYPAAARAHARSARSRIGVRGAAFLPARPGEPAALHARAPGRSVGFYVFEYQGHMIWGATAGMLVNLHKMLE